MLIEETANKIVIGSTNINKTLEEKKHAESEFGMKLY
jgi:hypothetical protein